MAIFSGIIPVFTRVLIVFMALLIGAASMMVPLSVPPANAQDLVGVGEADEYDETEEVDIADPMESLNRAFFVFNDRAYFWFVKPVSQTYGTVVPVGVRNAFNNGFNNLMGPSRMVNNWLQGKFVDGLSELARFLVNSTLGIAGLYEVAEPGMGLEEHDEDFGQTLGVWGMGHLAYINWPILGPSSVRDTLGKAVDYFMGPGLWLYNPIEVSVGVRAGEATNEVSTRIGEYEDLKASAVDPYVALRDAYIQKRQDEVSE